MSIEIIDLCIKPSKVRIAELLVRYHELLLKCELVYHPPSGTCWIRMPEIWLTREKKVTYCYWDSKQVSDDFQNLVLNKTFDKYDLDIQKVKDIHLEAAEIRSKKRSKLVELVG